MDAYAHLKVLVSLILGLSITRVLSGLSRRLQMPERTAAIHAQMIWSFVLLLSAVHFWWWEFALRLIHDWHFGSYVFVLAYASLFFLMATLIYPDVVAGHAESEAFFLRRRRGFFGLFGLSFVFDLFDTLLKGQAYLDALGWAYLLRLAVGGAIAAMAMRWGGDNRRLALLGLVWLLIDLGWILWRYDLLN